jgi:hypothetical protein
LSNDLETYLDGAFIIIKYHRNDAGHPTHTDFDRESSYFNFNLFPAYCRRISDLIGHFTYIDEDY